MFVISLVLTAVVHIALLPLQWAFWLLVPSIRVHEVVQSLRYALSSCIPFVLVACYRFFKVNKIENAFFSGLQVENAQLSQRIQKVQSHFQCESNVH